MIVVKLIYRILVIGAYFGLWRLPEQRPQTLAMSPQQQTGFGISVRQGRRLTMEDRAVVATYPLPLRNRCLNTSHISVLAVYDGHEGAMASEYLTRILHHKLRRAVLASYQSTCSLHTPKLHKAITHVTQRINRSILKEAKQRGIPDGSTAVFGMVAAEQLLIGNIGNSRALLCSLPPLAEAAGTQPSAVAVSNSSASHASTSSSSSNGTDMCRAHLPQPGASAKLGAAAGAVHSSSSNIRQRRHKHHQTTGSHTSSAHSCISCNTCRASIPFAQPSTHTTRHTSIQSSGQQAHLQDLGTCQAACNGCLLPHVLTQDHSPARPDEYARITARGGRVVKSKGGKSRLEGDLEVSRSFGDVGYQDKGLTAEPEFTSHNITSRDVFLVLASDGVFEVMEPSDVCLQAYATWVGSDEILPTPPRPPPIALGGTTGIVPEAINSNDASACGSGQSQRWERQTPGMATAAVGLTGCCDCNGDLRAHQDRTCDTVGGKPMQQKESCCSSESGFSKGLMDECIPADIPRPYTLQQAVAQCIVQEAYNRGSMDNLAVVVMSLADHVQQSVPLRNADAAQISHEASSEHAVAAVASGSPTQAALGQQGKASHQWQSTDMQVAPLQVSLCTMGRQLHCPC